MGFAVTPLLNADLRRMRDAIETFSKQLRPGVVGLFYFAGHGLQVKGENYLVLIGARIARDQDVEFETVHVGRILGAMEDANNGVNVIILDACRNNPFARSFRSSQRGLAVTQAITDQLAILRSPDIDPQKRADALRFLIHFVGDLHQPLHATSNNDQGGNCVPVAFFDALPQPRNPQTESYAPNLHGVWDTNILERATKGKTVDQVAADLEESYRNKIVRWQNAPANIDAWAWESFKLAQKQVYGKLPVRVPVESPQPITSCADDNHISSRMLKLDERLGEPYERMAVPIVTQRLAQAGARLALLLNQLWP